MISEVGNQSRLVAITRMLPHLEDFTTLITNMRQYLFTSQKD